MFKLLTRYSPLLYGIVIASVSVLIYVVTDAFQWEKHLGLDTLFYLRGIESAPDEVAIIALEKSSSDALHVANNPVEWPRNVHAQLIKKLHEAGAATISFDLFFRQPRNPGDDKQFADAIASTNNTLLVSHIQRAIQGPNYSPTRSNAATGINVETIIPPLSLFAERAVAVAPFVLPKYPAKVTDFWTYRTSAGDIPNLPAVTLQLYCQDGYEWIRQQLFTLGNHSIAETAQLPRLADLLSEQRLIPTMIKLRAIFNAEPLLSQRLNDQLQHEAELTPTQQLHIKALLALYSGAHRHYLNFYGPPWTIKTISYQQALATPADQLDIANRAVFVGFSERLQPEQKDNMNTVYSQPDGLDLSGVEIAATAFANLLQQRTIKALDPDLFLVLVFCYGLVIALLTRSVKPVLALSLTLVLAIGYMVTCVYHFQQNSLWLPWIIPLLVITPLTLLISISWHYFDAYQDRKRMRAAFSLYIPDQVISEISKQQNPSEPYQKVQYGIVMATDVAQYTSFAEQLHPTKVNQLLNQYYELLFRPVRNHGGIISDIIGDAMMAIWSAPSYTHELHQHACMAACEINQSLGLLNIHGDALPTRIGLHAGEIVMANVGAIDHFEYRPVGDTVNTAARIENFNKQLGTRCLASAEVVRGTTGILHRQLGTFIFAGKTRPIELYEILTLLQLTNEQQQQQCDEFVKGVVAYQNGNIQDANGIFTTLNQLYPADVPTQLYVELCQRAINDSSRAHMHGVITINTK